MTHYKQLAERINRGEVIILDGAIGTQLQVMGLPIAVAISEAGALWTQTCCDRQACAAQRSLPDDDHQFTGPCL